MSKHKHVITCVVEAIDADIQESHLNRQKLASLIWGEREPSAAYHVLQKKLTQNIKPNFTIQEVINVGLHLESTENTMRYICQKWGYNMPTRKSEDDEPIAEEAVKKLETNIDNLLEELLKQRSQKKELEAKINMVKTK